MGKLIAQYGPYAYYRPLNVFTDSKGSNFYILSFIETSEFLSDGKFYHIVIQHILQMADKFWCIIDTIKRAKSLENMFFAYAKAKAEISCGVTAQMISPFAFTTQYNPLFLHQKFQASSLDLALNKLVYIGPSLKPRRLVF